MDPKKTASETVGGTLSRSGILMLSSLEVSTPAIPLRQTAEDVSRLWLATTTLGSNHGAVVDI